MDHRDKDSTFANIWTRTKKNIVKADILMIGVYKNKTLFTKDYYNIRIKSLLLHRHTRYTELCDAWGLKKSPDHIVIPFIEFKLLFSGHSHKINVTRINYCIPYTDFQKINELDCTIVQAK